MIHLNPTITHDAAWWDRMYAEGKGQRWTVWNDPQLVISAIDYIESRSEDILLVACGFGTAAKVIRDTAARLKGRHQNYDFFGIDFVKREEFLDGVDWASVHDLNVYPWVLPSEWREAGMFDFAICSEILESLDDPAAAVRECQRIARRTMITLPISMDLLSEGHKWLFERSDAEALLPGCEVVELRGGKLLACFQR